jgi:hypothetical protein
MMIRILPLAFGGDIRSATDHTLLGWTKWRGKEKQRGQRQEKIRASLRPQIALGTGRTQETSGMNELKCSEVMTRVTDEGIGLKHCLQRLPARLGRVNRISN